MLITTTITIKIKLQSVQIQKVQIQIFKPTTTKQNIYDRVPTTATPPSLTLMTTIITYNYHQHTENI